MKNKTLIILISLMILILITTNIVIVNVINNIEVTLDLEDRIFLSILDDKEKNIQISLK